MQAIASVAFVTLLGLYVARNCRILPDNLPPGPRPLPLLGNIHQVPLAHPERTFAQWGSRYGDVIYLRMFTKPTLILNSIDAARELLDKRSTKYSGRPPSILLADLTGWGLSLPNFQMGERLRKQRRWLHTSLYAKSAVDKAEPAQMREARVLLAGLLDSPDRYSEHLHRYTTSVMMEVVYGHTVTAEDDRYMHTASEALRGTTEVAAAGANIVDFMPFLRHIPAWIPGARFKRLADETRDSVIAVHREPYALVENAMATGDDKPSMVRALIEEYSLRDMLEEEKPDIQNAAAISFLAGVETTKAALLIFVLAMVLHPEAQMVAQREIDSVVGFERLPDLRDRTSLPYVECILQEVYRWQCPVPLGLPHLVSEEDEYRGYRIPEGCMTMANLWRALMMRDPDLYPDPDIFRPERYYGLPSDEAKRLDPRNIVFGYGRRICPGRRFADTSDWLVIAAILATFNIRKARDATGNEIIPPIEFTSGSVTHPRDCVCSIMPRSERATELIRRPA
ncbi:hypothetical protein FOMPIDRAFT_1123536 [Fomitopsis schrenkii]|uniref:Cytochrome P450 n=1 Tax=Fomitopsis schrenkii TaxID=2126942 RepID=S8E9G2_FOMSC|nr:hypothetical protein FOMPIDRAFT_1123536 [Fomitopsis schrenkii]